LLFFLWLVKTSHPTVFLSSVYQNDPSYCFSFFILASYYFSFFSAWQNYPSYWEVAWARRRLMSGPLLTTNKRNTCLIVLAQHSSSYTHLLLLNKLGHEILWFNSWPQTRGTHV
jgi:hypothetical protein